MKHIKLPVESIILRETNPTVVNLVIKILKLAGVHIHEGTKEYDGVIDNKNKIVTVGCQVIPFDKVKEIVRNFK